MIMKLILTAMAISFSFLGHAQKNIDELLARYNNQSIPYISVQELRMNEHKHLILDTRKKEEYDVSHIPGAVWASEKPKKTFIEALLKANTKPVVVYCTVGIRSEDFGLTLKKMGVAHVKNLYGSIFAWKDAGFKIIDKAGKETENVHTYSRVWKKYLKTGNAVY